MRIDQFIYHSSQLIESSEAGDSARLDAELLLAKVLNKSRSYFYSHPEYLLSDKQLEMARGLVELRCQGRPIAYLQGQKEFWSLSLAVNDSVLIPRPETEMLVEFAIQLDLPANASVVDLGTGSGAIALALASEKKSWQITAVEYIDAALKVAKHNIEMTAAKDFSVLHLIQASWLSAFAEHSFDLVIANPPYIDYHDPHLKQGDVRYEPSTALVSNEQGLADIKSIALQSTHCLRPGGYLIMEHGCDQSQQVKEILNNNDFIGVQCHRDLSDNFRFVSAMKK